MTVDLSAIQATYINLSETEGKTPGREGGVTVSYADGELLFTEADGDEFRIQTEELTDAELEQLSKELNTDIETKGTEETNSTDAADNAKKAELEAKKTKLEGQWNDLKDEADGIKEEVEKLSKEIEEEFAENLKKQREVTEAEEKAIEDFVQQQIEQFKKDKENGKNVSLDDLKGSIIDGMPTDVFDAEMKALMADLIVTNAKMVAMDSLLSELGVLNTQMRDIDKQIADVEEAIKEAEEAECTPPPKSCDPIGFTMTDADGNEVKYDFIVDDGAFDSTSDFLGAEDQWAAMEKLDTDGDGIVTAAELKAGNVKAVKTVNGQVQDTPVDMADEFGDDFSINLASYKQGGAHSAVSTADADGDGTLDQELLGTFSVNINGQEIEGAGYNTLDDVDWLKDTYGVEVAGAGAAAGEAGEAVDKATGEREEYSAGLDAFIEEYEAKLVEYQQQFTEVVELLGLDQELIDTIKEYSEAYGQAAAEKIIADHTVVHADENEEDGDDNTVEGAEGAENEDAEKEKKDEEEAA